jgi:hypothetical protein
MGTNHETIVYTVDKRRYKQKKLVKRILFRTRKAANDFQTEQNIKSKTFEYGEPVKSYWGPDN